MRPRSGTNISLTDLTMTLMLAYLIVIAIMIKFLNPPASAENSTPPGNLMATLIWDQGDLDVDLWMVGPGEPRPVGYSNKGGVLWNLLRDDLGSAPDATMMNYENAYTRGIVPGEYIFNVHCYRCAVTPINATLEIAVNTNDGSSTAKTGTKVLQTVKFKINTQGQEKTVIRFKLKEGGTIDPASINTIQKKLRSADKTDTHEPF